tara:strand:- start:41 stop:358 length:318 start_codon:yes stop_codon:yes gene_type:complete
MILGIIGTVLSIGALSLIYWLRKEQTMDNGLHAAEVDHIHQGMNALMNDFNNYQVETDRKISELEKQLEIKTKQLERSQTKLKKDLPTDIRKVIGHIEFARPLDK